MGRINATFEQLKSNGEVALVPFITAGDPDLATTEAIVRTLVEAGADLIELGFPFSDPMADGPVIQASSERALVAGTTLAGVLEVVTRVRLHTAVPIVLMGYFNPVFRYGVERFGRDAVAAGVDGVLLVDLPPEESAEVTTSWRSLGLQLITLLAPTTPPERMARLATAAEGYLYYVSMTGVTGAQAVDPTAIAGEVQRLRGMSRVPVAVGFGISTPADAAAVAGFADAVVVGSALVKVIAQHAGTPALLPEVGAFVRRLKDGIAGRAG